MSSLEVINLWHTLRVEIQNLVLTKEGETHFPCSKVLVQRNVPPASGHKASGLNWSKWWAPCSLFYTSEFLVSLGSSRSWHRNRCRDLYNDPADPDHRKCTVGQQQHISHSVGGTWWDNHECRLLRNINTKERLYTEILILCFFVRSWNYRTYSLTNILSRAKRTLLW